MVPRMHAKYPRRDVLTWILYGLFLLSSCVVVKLYIVLNFNEMKTEILTILVKNVLYSLMFFPWVSLFSTWLTISAPKLSGRFPLLVNSGCIQGRFA